MERVSSSPSKTPREESLRKSTFVTTFGSELTGIPREEENSRASEPLMVKEAGEDGQVMGKMGGPPEGFLDLRKTEKHPLGFIVITLT
jgi:hypothetical protein